MAASPGCFLVSHWTLALCSRVIRILPIVCCLTHLTDSHNSNASRNLGAQTFAGVHICVPGWRRHRRHWCIHQLFAGRFQDHGAYRKWRVHLRIGSGPRGRQRDRDDQRRQPAQQATTITNLATTTLYRKALSARGEPAAAAAAALQKKKAHRRRVCSIGIAAVDELQGVDFE